MAKTCNGWPTPLYSPTDAARECLQLSRKVDLKGVLSERGARHRAKKERAYAAVAAAGMNS